MKGNGASFVQMTLYHFRELYRNKIALFFNLMFPLLLVVIFGTLFGANDRPAITPIGIVYEQSDAAGNTLSGALDESGLYFVQRGTKDELEDALKSGRIRAVVDVPSPRDNPASADLQPLAVGIIYDPLSPASSRTGAELQMFVNSLGVRLAGIQPTLVTAVQPLSGVEARDVFDYLMPGMMVVMLLASGLMTVSITVAEQRSSGALRHLFSTPLPMSVWTGARMTANLLMAFVQGTLLFTFARIVFDVGPPVNLPATLVVVGLSSLAVLGIGLLIGILVKNDDTAVAVSMPVMMFLMFLGNAAMPLEDPPAFIAAMLSWMPTFHMTEAMRAVMRDGQGLTSIGAELLLIGGLAFLLLGTSIWLMRRQYVMQAD